METIIVNCDSLNRTAEELLEILQDVKEVLGEMECSEADLNGMWDGESRETFRQRFEEDMKELKAGLQDLSDMAAYQRKTAREYLACEERAAGMIESISNQ